MKNIRKKRLLLLWLIFVVLICLQGYFWLNDYDISSPLLLFFFVISSLLIPHISGHFSSNIISKFLGKETSESLESIRLNQVKLNVILERIKFQVEKDLNDYRRSVKENPLEYIEERVWKCYQDDKKEVEIKGKLEYLFEVTKKSPYQSFIIVGEAGVGKSTMLNEFIGYKLDQFKTEKVVPVLFSLSSWRKEQSFVDWMINELSRVYGYNYRILRYLLDNAFLIPVLDGLNQLKYVELESAIKQINEFSKTNMVALSTRPNSLNSLLSKSGRDHNEIRNFFSIYHLQPLRIEELELAIKDYEILNLSVNRSTKTLNLLRYPMTLNIMLTVISQMSHEDIAEINRLNEKELNLFLWKEYEEYVLNKDSNKKASYSKREVKSWLRTLAIHFSNEILFIENFQPAVLSQKSLKLVYYYLSRAICSILLIIGVGFFMSGPFDFINGGLIGGLIISFVTLNKQISRFISRKTIYPFLSYLSGVLVFLIPLICILAMGYGLSTERMTEDMIMNKSISLSEFNIGVFVSIFLAVPFGIRFVWQNKSEDIRVFDNVSLKWKQFLTYGILGGLLLGAFLLVCTIILLNLGENLSISKWLMEESTGINSFILAFTSGFIFGIPLIGVLGWLDFNNSSFTKDYKVRENSNHNVGIHKSLKNSFVAGVTIAIMFAIFYSCLFGILFKDISSIIKAIKVGIGSGILAALWFGGMDVIQHYVLRMIVFVFGKGPFLYNSFFKYCLDLRILRKVGTGYEFIHPTFGQYFLESSSSNIMQKTSSYSLLIRYGFIITLTFLLIISIVGPLKLWKKEYWSDMTQLEFIKVDPLVSINNKNTVRIKKKGDVLISAYGSSTVGAFTGRVYPEGTESGFMGFPIGQSFDIDSSHINQQDLSHYRHASLLVWNHNRRQWYSFEEGIYFPWEKRSLLISDVEKDDSLTFVVNDKEFQNNYDKYNVNIQIIDSGSVKIIGHRGSGGLNVENSMDAIQYAIDIGVDQIEMDIRQTKDGKLILMHDKKINSTTNGSGYVHNQTYQELQKFTLNDSSSSQSIPLLTEVLKLMKSRNIDALIEVKNPNLYKDIEDSLINLLDRYDLRTKVEVFSFDRDFIESFKIKNPDIKVGIFIISPLFIQETDIIESVGVYYPFIKYELFNEKLKNKGFKNIYAWTVNHTKHMDALVNQGVNAIITDYPEKFLKNQQN